MRRTRFSSITVFAASTALIVPLILVLAAGCGSGGGQANVDSASTVSMPGTGPSAMGGPITKNMIYDQYVRRIQAGIEPDHYTPKLSREEAEKQAGFKLKFPRETLGGKLTGIYAQETPSGDSDVAFFYSNGISLGLVAMSTKPDYVGMIAEAATLKNTPGHQVLGTEGQRVVSVAGNEGVAVPENQIPGLDNQTYRLPPSVGWWENGVAYTMTLWKLGLTDTQLMEVAESIYK
jgi:hypothetical protein